MLEGGGIPMSPSVPPVTPSHRSMMITIITPTASVKIAK